MPPLPIDPIGAAVHEIVSEMAEMRKTLEETNRHLGRISEVTYMMSKMYQIA